MESGLLVVTTPSPLGESVHGIGSRLGLFYQESVVEHVRIFRRNELIKMLNLCVFEVVESRSFALGLNQLVVVRPIGLGKG